MDPDPRQIADLVTIGQVEAAARAALPPHLWDFSAGGAGTGASIRIAREALERCTFRPRVLRDVSRRTSGPAVLGREVTFPVLLAPIGSIARFHPDGAAATARAASREGVVGFMGGLALPAMEDVAAAATAPMVYQVYQAGGRDWLAALVDRVERAGFTALCLTVDSRAAAFRDRDREHGWSPRVIDDHPNLLGAGDEDIGRWEPRFTWADVAWLRERTSLPLILKGILHPEDAVLAVEHGVDVVYVSNHGGLELDYAPAPLDVLPVVVEAVAGRAGVFVDGGFLRGTDIVKGLALGATAVGIGKLHCWGAAIGGAAGISRVLQILREEVDATMAMLGVADVRDLGPEYVDNGR